VLPALALAIVALAAPPAPTPAQITKAYLRHERTGEYQYFGLLPADWKAPYALDRDGVPLVDYPGGPEHNPVTTAQYGLAQWTIGLRHRRPGRVRIAIRMADWLVRTQRHPSGKWLYRFDYRVPGAGVLPAPWASALAQGQAISLLRRAYARTGKARYLSAARRALRPLRRPVSEGGLLRRWRGSPSFEEYPTREAPTFVLNGFQQCLLGLYDLSDLSPVSRRLFRRGMDALVAILPAYDMGNGWSTYSLAHLYWPSPRTAATASYHLSHVGMLRLLDRLRPNGRLQRYSRLWLQGLQPARDYSRGV
jgi:heparosan-N-sulfate-glucuronate 5-epimerase